VHECAQGPAGVRADGAVAGQDDGVLGGHDHLGGALELLHARLGLDRRAAGQRRRVQWAHHHVLGQFQVGGAGLLGLGHLKGLANHFGNDFGAGNPCIPLHDRAHDPEQVDVLV
jgi:hypothetical protein